MQGGGESMQTERMSHVHTNTHTNAHNQHLELIYCVYVGISVGLIEMATLPVPDELNS